MIKTEHHPSSHWHENMTLEELWELFPIELVAHRPQWKKWAKEEADFLVRILSDYSPTITHIGSTAIPTICAKPIVDLLVEIPPTADRRLIRTVMEKNGYICMSDSETRMSFNKGYTPEGYAEKVFHIHIHPNGDNDEILFRDYLLTHPEAAHEYETLKMNLLPEYRHNRDAYTKAKTEFVRRMIKLSKNSC